MKEEAVKAEIKTEDDVSTDDEQYKLENVISSPSRYDDPVKNEETDDEDLVYTNITSNEHHLPIKVKAEVKTEEDDVSTDDEYVSQEPVKPLDQPNSSSQESMDIQHTRKKKRHCSKRKREVEKSNRSVEKATRIECSVEGCTRKAADSGTCKTKHGGRNYCSQDGCTNYSQKGGVCIRHARKKDYRTCSIEGCNRKAAGNGRCRIEHGGYNLCNQDGCTNRVQKGGVCLRHGAVVRYTCRHEGCTNQVKRSRGVCTLHEAKQRAVLTCKREGCPNPVGRQGGVCILHTRLSKDFKTKSLR